MAGKALTSSDRITIKQHESIKGIKAKHSHHKMSLYADDIVLFLNNSHSVNEIPTVINEFFSISYYSINSNKLFYYHLK